MDSENESFLIEGLPETRGRKVMGRFSRGELWFQVFEPRFNGLEVMTEEYARYSQYAIRPCPIDNGALETHASTPLDLW